VEGYRHAEAQTYACICERRWPARSRRILRNGCRERDKLSTARAARRGYEERTQRPVNSTTTRKGRPCLVATGTWNAARPPYAAPSSDNAARLPYVVPGPADGGSVSYPSHAGLYRAAHSLFVTPEPDEVACRPYVVAGPGDYLPAIIAAASGAALYRFWLL